MDFDASQFLSMDITEDNQEISIDPGPDEESQPTSGHNEPTSGHNEPTKENDNAETGKITVTGGLQIEPVGMELPVPRFDTLFGSAEEMIQNNYGPLDADAGAVKPLEVTVPEGNGDDSGVGHESPGERANSPADRIRKSIPVSYDEQRFRKEVFCGAYEKVKLFRLHCTSCDRHLGCAPQYTTHYMRAHKLLSLAVCRSCFEYYGNRGFPVEDGSEIYCCWCGEGGNLYCCSTCPKTVCKKCVIQNFGREKVKEIEENDNWQCFICKPEEIYPHRSIYWAWQHMAKRTRQNLFSSPKEIKDILLSKDSSHCCTDDPIEANLFSLPSKSLLSKFPQCLIAPVHLSAVKNQPDPLPVVAPANTAVVNRGSLVNGDIGTVKMPVNRVTPQQSNAYKPLLGTPVRFRLPAPGQGPMTRIINPLTLPYQQPKMRYPSHQLRMQILHQQLNRSRPYPVPMLVRPTQANRPRSTSLLMTALEVQPESNQSQDVNQHRHSTHPPSVVDLVDDDDSPPLPASSGSSRSGSLDITWLEQGAAGIKGCIIPITQQLSQFSLAKEDFKSDFSSLSNFVDKLSYNIKIAICQLAKINANLQDAMKDALDNQVASVVSEVNKSAAVQLTGKSASDAPQSMVITPVSSEVPDPKPVVETPSTSKDEPITLSPALLCETVIEAETEKEVVKESSPKPDSEAPRKLGRPKKMKRGRPKKYKNSVQKYLDIRNNLKAKLNSTTSSPPSASSTALTTTAIVHSDPVQKSESEFNKDFYCRKFNIKPCKVVLTKCDGQ